MRKTAWLTLVVLACLGLARAAGAGEMPKVKYILSAKKGTTHYPATLAEHLGFFKEDGYNIEVLPGGGSGYVVQQIAANKLDIGQGSPGAIFMGLQRGYKFKGVYTILLQRRLPAHYAGREQGPEGGGSQRERPGDQ